MRPPWWWPTRPLSLADGAREGDDLDAPRACGAKCRRGHRRRRTSRVDVVDEDHRSGSPRGGGEGAAHVSPAVGEVQAGLARDDSLPPEERHRLGGPARLEAAREGTRRTG